VGTSSVLCSYLSALPTLTSMPVLSAPLADIIALGELGGEDPRILRGVDLPEIDEADCALTVTRSRCSTFRHGP